MLNNKQIAELGGDPLINNTSVFSHLEQGLLRDPDKPAILCMHQPANYLSGLLPRNNEYEHVDTDVRSDCLALTYSQLHSIALGLAAGLVSNGVQPGSLVLMLSPNGCEHYIITWTCTILRLGLAAVDPSALDASRKEELQDLIRTLKPGLVVVPDRPGAKAADDAIVDENLPQPLRVTLSNDFVDGWKTFRRIASSSLQSPTSEESLLEAARRDDPNRIHSVLFTSGTSTGRPKGCPMRTGSMTHVLHSQSWLINQANCDFVLQQAHNSRSVAQQTTLQTWREGGTLITPGGGFAIQDTLDAITQYGATFVILSPAMVHVLLEEIALRPADLASVRTVQVGGDAVTKDLLMKCDALFPHANVCSNHGMTEGGGFFTWPFHNKQVAEIPYFGEICPIGTVAAGARLRIWDADNQKVMERGQPGELHVRCESIIRHYLNGASESSFYEDEQGHWFVTGDIAIISDADMVYVLGRSKDVIKRAGIAIMPAALESCIEKYTGAQVSITYLYKTVYRQERANIIVYISLIKYLCSDIRSASSPSEAWQRTLCRAQRLQLKERERR